MSALGRYDNNEFEEALGEFEMISDTSKILFNMGVIHATLGEHEKAVREGYFFLTNCSALMTITRSSAIREPSDWIRISPSHIFSRVYQTSCSAISKRR